MRCPGSRSTCKNTAVRRPEQIIYKIRKFNPKYLDMNKKTTLLSILFTITVSSLFAQEVVFKDSKALLDGNPILKYERVDAFQYSFYSLENDDEVLMYKFFDNGTPRFKDDDYYVLNFLTEKKKVESMDFSKVLYGSELSPKKNMQKLIKWLVKEKVLTAEGKINKEKLDIFYDKYNENITARIIR